MDIRKTVTHLTRNIFPGLPQQINSVDKTVLSNLPLQMALYFNGIFAPVWIIVILLFLEKNVRTKYSKKEYNLYSSYVELYRYITITVICTSLFVEMLRLYLGYEGNLKDKIPELAGFWMLSILLQFPLQGFLLFNPYFQMYILEIIVQSIMFVLLCIQMVSGYFALKFIAIQQSKLYQKNAALEENKTDLVVIEEE